MQGVFIIYVSYNDSSDHVYESKMMLHNARNLMFICLMPHSILACLAITQFFIVPLQFLNLATMTPIATFYMLCILHAVLHVKVI